MKKKHIEALTEVKDGKMTAIASTEDNDRVGDVLKVSDWDLSKFKKNPVLQAGHDYRPQFTIGVAENIRIEGKRLLFEPKFHTLTQLASDIKAMFENKILKAWSVGFIPGDKNELLEVSAVAVPANASALTQYKGLEQAMNLKEEEQTEVKEKIDTWLKEKGCCGTSGSKTDALPAEEEEPTEPEEEPEKENIEEVIEEKELEEEKIEEVAEETDKVEDAPEEVAEEIEEVIEADEIVEKEIKQEEKECECLECGHIMKTDKHCDEIKCSECGGKMRRKERPGPGKKDEEKAKVKSPACRMENETEEECVARKIPEIKKEDPEMDDKQVQAIAINMCKTKCDDKKKSLEAEVKEGKVISKKNKTIINDAIESLNKSVVALEKLLELSEPSEDGEKIQAPAKAKETTDVKQKVDKPKKVDRNDLSEDKKLILRTLQQINKVSNFGLNKLKNKK